MARLPDVMDRRLPRVQRGVAQLSGVTAVGDALDRAGRSAAALGDLILDREATAAAKERDAQVADQFRKLLYDPETGYLNMDGGNAVAARERTISELEKLKASASEGLNRAAATKLEASIDGRFERAVLAVDSHASGARKVWIEGASNARIQSAYQDGLVDPTQMSASMAIIEGELQGKAAREGWAPEKLAAETAAAKSKLMTDQVLRIAANDPIAAMEFMRANESAMVQSDVAAIEAKLTPEVKGAIGREKGRAAAGGVPIYDHQTTIEYAMGPARPNKPDAVITSLIGRTAEDILGPGAKVVVTSGKEDEGKQHGSNRHGTGHAADVEFFRPDGTKVLATDPEAVLIAKQAAKNGALGIGFGAEYMGGDHFHIDIVEPGSGQANTWASGGVAIRDEIVGLIGQRKARGNEGLQGILDIVDPVEREAALAEYDLRTSVAAGERKAAKEAASQAAFAHIEGGGLVDDLPLDVRTAIGAEAMSSLRTYQSKLLSGVPVETDDQAYYNLQKMRAENPNGFRELDLMTYRHLLSDQDWQAMVDAQTKPASDISAMAASTLMETASRHMKAAGLDPNAKDGDGAARVAALQTRLLHWQDNYIKANGKAPEQVELDKYVNQQLVPVVIDAPGWGAPQDFKGAAFELKTGGDPMVQGDELSPQILRQSTLTINGKDVSVDMMTEFATGFEQTFGYAPTAEELISGLIESGLF